MSFFSLQHREKGQQGFTLIELAVSVSIFAFLTAFLVARYGSFNSSVLLTNLAYDVALTIRNAQTYGLNVKSRPTDNTSYTTGTNYAEIAAGYQTAYAVHFESNPNGAENSRLITFFADSATPPVYSSSAKPIAQYTLRNGYISSICVKVSEDQNCLSDPGAINIWFKRPDPDAHFSLANITYAELTITSASGASRRVLVRKTGQIAILRN